VPGKRALLLRGHVALWDVLASCDVTGSADGSIRNAVPNDIGLILRNAPVRAVFANGQTAASLYRRYCQPLTGVPIAVLPSTSPANARWSLPLLTEAWRPLAHSVREPDAC
jgi:hypoxanthine-DNA glycosylase